MPKLKAISAGTDLGVSREVLDLLNQPAHVRQASVTIVADTKADAVRYVQGLRAVGNWVAEPYAPHLRISEGADTEALAAAGLFTEKAVFVTPCGGYRGWGVVRIDHNGPKVIGDLVRDNGSWTFEPAGTLHVKFTPDAVQALRSLLGLAHYDSLALEWRALLPAELLAADVARVAEGNRTDA